MFCVCCPICFCTRKQKGLIFLLLFLRSKLLIIYDVYWLLLFFWGLAVIVSNKFNATEIIFDPKLQELFYFRSKLPNDDLVISREDFDPKYIPFKVDLYVVFFVNNPIRFITGMNVSNEACCAYWIF